MNDANVLEVARDEANQIWQIDNWREQPSFEPLAETLEPTETGETYFD